MMAAFTQAARVSVARATLGGALGGNRMRVILTVLAIALGVALGFAVQLINQTAIAEFSAGLASLAGDTDLEVRGSRAGVDETLYPAFARDQTIAAASPVLEIEAKVAGRSESLRILGVDAFRAGTVTPALLGASEDSLDALRPNVLFVSPAAAAWLDADIGDTIGIQAGLAEIRLRIAGFVRAETAQRYAVMDIAAAQDAFARVGRLSRIDLRLRPGADVATVRARLQELLPAGVIVERPQAAATATTRMSRAYRVNLNVLALVALFTGGLLVFSTQALSVLRRRSQFALLRTLG
ncbi:MAG: ABC transporter permease, partial [Betaproteobacteria bacterium]|nr:ABC transporter permease [Betaproteobacteria bacterium]